MKIVDVTRDQFGNAFVWRADGSIGFRPSAECIIPRNFSPSDRSCYTGTDGIAYCSSYTSFRRLCKIDHSQSGWLPENLDHMRKLQKLSVIE